MAYKYNYHGYGFALFGDGSEHLPPKKYKKWARIAIGICFISVIIGVII